MKMADFWDAALCGLVGILTDVSVPLKRRSVSIRLHGTTSLKTAILKLVSVKTSNHLRSI
jgi:hypothetical protein